MNIAIDARMYHIKGGHGRYLQELIRHLEQIDSKNRYTIILQPEGFSSYTPSNPNFRAISTNTRWYTLSEQTKFLRLLNNIRADIVHFPHWNIPLGYRKPFVVTIHDLILLEYPTSAASTRNPLFYWIKYLAFRIILKNATKQAKHIIAISEFTKSQIEEHFPYLETPVATIHIASGIGTGGARSVIASGAERSAAISEFRSTEIASPVVSLPSRNDNKIITNYFLYIGVAFPHKNLPFLLHAFHQFNIRYGRTHKLVLAGAKNKFYERLFKSDTARAMLERGDLVFIDSPGDETLEQLYQNATAVMCPSLMEGFGLPPLEAAGRGIPAVCSDIPAHREIMADATNYFPPPLGGRVREEGSKKEIENLITSLHLLATDNNYRYFLSLKSLERTQNFSWKKTAEETLTIYRHLA